jgi:ADP-ribosylglycohydrolase
MAIEQFVKQPQDYPASDSDKARSGNGNLMRFAPVPLFYRKNALEALTHGVNSSRTTHGSQLCCDASRYYTSLFLGILHGATKEQLLGKGEPDPSGKYVAPTLESTYWTSNPLAPEVEAVCSGSYRVRQPPEIKSTGFVVDSLECALWAWYNTDTFKEGLIQVVNLGGMMI